MAYQNMQSQAPPGKQSPLKDEEADPLERNSMHLQHMKALDTVSSSLSPWSSLSWSSTIYGDQVRAMAAELILRTLS